ncbi:MAG: hypothetical protein PVJ86_07365 [Phycisphaerales bacterium]|jgi:hypothetical protein
MKEHENSLEKAVEALKNEHIPPGPPQELADGTIAKLTEASGQSPTVPIENRIRIMEMLKATKGLTKVAAAAVLFILAGYATARLSAPRPPDVEELRAALEPAIRRNLVTEMKDYLQLGLTNGYIRLRDELSRQYRQDMSRFAIQTLAASNAVTNELLTELIESINTAQVQDRQWVTAAIEQIEWNRLQDKNQFATGLETLAIQTIQTGDELERTKQDMVQLLVYAKPGSIAPNPSENPDNPNE